MSATKETYEAAVAAFAEAKKAASEIRVPGWTVYEIVPREDSPILSFHLRYKVTESLEAAMSKPLSREGQYFIVEEKFAADGTRWSDDDKSVETFQGYGVTGWIRDMTIDLNGSPRPDCHDRWFHVRIRHYTEEAVVLDGVLQPAEWIASQGSERGNIRLIFEAGKEASCCDGDCCCGDSDTGSEGGYTDYSDDE